jgi:hypothetical protein
VISKQTEPNTTMKSVNRFKFTIPVSVRKGFSPVFVVPTLWTLKILLTVFVLSMTIANIKFNNVIVQASDPETITTTASSTTTNNECEVGTDGTTCINAVTDNNSDGTDTDEDILQLLKGLNVTVEDDGVTWIDTGYGVTQQVVGQHKRNSTLRILDLITYMKDRVMKASSDDVLSSVAASCILRNDLCVFWAEIGECEANPGSFHLTWYLCCFTIV